jgi:hypothetical protein
VLLKPRQYRSLSGFTHHNLGLDIKPFDLAAALGLVGFGMHQGDAKRGGDFLKVSGPEGRAVVDVEFSRQSPFEKRLAEGIEVGVEPFREKELGVGNEPAHIVKESKEIGLALLFSRGDHRAVHGIALPVIPQAE